MSVTTIGAIAAARRPRWQYPPPPPTPRIIHLPRRSRRRPLPKLKRPSNPPPPSPSPPPGTDERIGKLEALFGQERAFAKESVPIVVIGERRRGRVRVEERDSAESVAVAGGGGELEEEKWRFQAEMLRAECNLMRMEKEIAVKKMERARVRSQRALRFAVHSLASERKKISEGNNSKAELVEEIQQLAEKLERLRRNLEVETNPGARRKCHNFDEQAADVQRELKIFRGSSDEVCVKKIREMAEVSLSVETMCKGGETLVSSDDSNVEILRRKMEGLSNGTLLERMKEQCGSMLSTADSSVASSASTSKRIEIADSTSPSIQTPLQEMVSRDKNVCSGRCKVVVRRILGQVRAETEQWSQMQEMLGQVREEMEDLQASRDFWEDRALDYDYQMQSLRSGAREWRRKAITSESKVNQLEARMYFLGKELERSRKEEKSDATRVEPSPPRVALDGQLEMEKRVLICRLKENQNNSNNNNLCHYVHAMGQSQTSNKQKEGASSDGRRRKTHARRTIGLVASERPPLKEIGNSCVSFKQQNKATFPSVPSRTSKNF